MENNAHFLAWGFLRHLFAGVVTAIVLAACGGGGGGGGETAVSPPPTTPAPTIPAEPPPSVPAEPPPTIPPEPPPATPAEPPPSPPVTGTLSLVAGSLDTSAWGQGTADGFGVAVRFSSPAGLVLSRGSLFVADFGNNTIRRISPIGDVTTYAGVPGPRIYCGTFGGCLDSAPDMAATFSGPTGLAADAAGVLYVTDGLRGSWDSNLTAVRVIDTDGQVSTFKPAPTGPSFSYLGGIVVDADRDIYARSTAGGISRFAPDGSSQVVAAIPAPWSYGLARDANGNLYVSNLNSIEKVTPNGEIVHLAGPQYPVGMVDYLGVWLAGSADGLGTAARLSILGGNPWPRASFAVDSHGNLYVSDINNHTIRKVTPEGLVTTIAGKAGTAGMQLGPLPGLLTFPAGLALQDDKTLFVASGNAVLRIRLD